MTRRAVVLTSGGVDSLICLVLAAKEYKEVYPLFIGYGQKAAHVEFAIATDSLVKLATGVEGLDPIKNIKPLERMNIGIPPIASTFPLVGDSTSSSRFRPHVSKAVLPMRNTLLISCGFLYAMNIKAMAVFHGASGDDQDSFPDCRPYHLGKILDMIRQEYAATFELDSTKGRHGNSPRLELVTPLIVPSRSEYVGVFGKWVRSIPTLSCYYPLSNKPCGVCEACKNKDPV